MLKLKQSKADPCVFYKRDERGRLLLLLCTHVDDTLIAGYKKVIDQFLDEFETHLKIDRLGRMRKHLGVWWEWCRNSNGETYLKASMPKMVQEIEDAFVAARGRKPKAAPTPGYPGKMLRKNDGETIMLKEYRSIVGKIMYYTTKIGPEMASAARDLASHMADPGEEHWKHLERCVGYLTNMEEDKRPLTFRRPRELRSISYADSDYAKCEDTRKSISGGLNTIGGTITNFYSRKQDTVALSSSEAEITSYVTCCQEAIFQNMLLMEILGKKPETAIILEDNMGCIFWIKNQHVSQRTKHIDVRMHFVRNRYYDEGDVEPRFVRTELQYSDGMTKSLPEKLFTKHRDDIRSGNLPCRREDVENINDVTTDSV